MYVFNLLNEVNYFIKFQLKNVMCVCVCVCEDIPISFSFAGPVTFLSQKYGF